MSDIDGGRVDDGPETCRVTKCRIAENKPNDFICLFGAGPDTQAVEFRLIGDGSCHGIDKDFHRAAVSCAYVQPALPPGHRVELDSSIPGQSGRFR